MTEEIIGRLCKECGLEARKAADSLGDDEVYVDCVNDFYLTLNDNIEHIKETFIACNWKNYAVLVHGMKSTLRLIGEYELGDFAYKLELAGKDENDVIIKAETGRFLLELDNLRDKLAAVYEKNNGSDSVIDDALLKESIANIVSFADSFDFDGIDEIMDMLETYKMPDDFQGTYVKLKSLVANVARDEIIQLLGGK